MWCLCLMEPNFVLKCEQQSILPLVTRITHKVATAQLYTQKLLRNEQSFVPQQFCHFLRLPDFVPRCDEDKNNQQREDLSILFQLISFSDNGPSSICPMIICIEASLAASAFEVSFLSLLKMLLLSCIDCSILSLIIQRYSNGSSCSIAMIRLP